MSDRPPSPRPRVEQITGKGEEVGEKEMGGGVGCGERGAVNKELPLCEVLRWVQSSRLPEGPRFVRHPTREASGSEAGRRAPVSTENIYFRARPHLSG